MVMINGLIDLSVKPMLQQHLLQPSRSMVLTVEEVVLLTNRRWQSCMGVAQQDLHKLLVVLMQ